MFTGGILKKYNELDMKIYEFIIHNSLEVTYMSIRELAQAIPTSTASIIRFCKKNGYEGYNEFKYAFRSSMKQETVYRHYDHNEVIDCLKKLDNKIYHERVNEAIVLLGNADMVLFLGIGDSGIIGQYGARRFSSYGKFAMAINDPYYQINIVGSNTVVVALSVSGETPELIREIHACKIKGCQVIGITSASQSTLAKISDVVIPYYIHIKKRGPVMFTSQAPALSIIENLATLSMKNQ